MKSKLLNKKWFMIFTFTILVIILTLLSTGKGLRFGFWRDDWLYIWGFKISGNPAEIFRATKLAESYPLDYYRILLLSWILDTNPLGWQISSVFFRMLVPFAAALFAWALTRSRLTAFLVGLFSAAGVAGLEPAVFMGANNVSFYLIFLLLGFYFWIKSLDQSIESKRKKFFNKNYFIAILILAIVTKGEMWSYYITPMLTLGWDILIFATQPSRQNLKIIVARNVIFIGILAILFPLPPNGILRDNGLNKLTKIKPGAVKNLFSSIGNLVLGSFYYVPESGGLSGQSRNSIVVGIAVMVVSTISVLLFLLKRKRSYAVIAFCFMWFFIYYFPNWVFESTLTVAASHRYLAISAITFQLLIAYLMLIVRPKALMIVFCVTFILTNIYLSNKILDTTMLYRSEKVIDNVITTMNNQIPANQKDFVISYEGDGTIRGYILDWSLGIPIALKRNISNRAEFPIWTGNKETVLKLLCGEKISVNMVGRGEIVERGGYPFSKEQIHNFYVKDTGETIVRSKQYRSTFNIPADCPK